MFMSTLSRSIDADVPAELHAPADGGQVQYRVGATRSTGRASPRESVRSASRRAAEVERAIRMVGSDRLQAVTEQATTAGDQDAYVGGSRMPPALSDVAAMASASIRSAAAARALDVPDEERSGTPRRVIRTSAFVRARHVRRLPQAAARYVFLHHHQVRAVGREVRERLLVERLDGVKLPQGRRAAGPDSASTAPTASATILPVVTIATRSPWRRVGRGRARRDRRVELRLAVLPMVKYAGRRARGPAAAVHGPRSRHPASPRHAGDGAMSAASSTRGATRAVE